MTVNQPTYDFEGSSPFLHQLLCMAPNPYAARVSAIDKCAELGQFRTTGCGPFLQTALGHNSSKFSWSAGARFSLRVIPALNMSAGPFPKPLWLNLARREICDGFR